MIRKFIKYLLFLAAALLVIVSVCGLAGCKSDGGGNVPNVTITPVPADDGLPEDPGEAGMATLVGIDSDSDGVRDDVQRYIALTYPESEKIRAALTQYAITMQDALLDADDKEKSVRVAQNGTKSQACLWYVFGSVRLYGDARDDIMVKLLNTDERNYAYFAYNDQLGGEVFPGIPYDERSSACEFEVDSLAD